MKVNRVRVRESAPLSSASEAAAARSSADVPESPDARVPVPLDPGECPYCTFIQSDGFKRWVKCSKPADGSAAILTSTRGSATPAELEQIGDQVDEQLLSQRA